MEFVCQASIHVPIMMIAMQKAVNVVMVTAAMVNTSTLWQICLVSTILDARYSKLFHYLLQYFWERETADRCLS